MLALVEGGEGFAIHRTYLTADGVKAAVDPVKMALGAVAGGSVRLICGKRGVLAVAEGIESALSIPALDPRLTGASVWAALSASGMRSLRLPMVPCLKDVVDLVFRTASGGLDFPLVNWP